MGPTKYVTSMQVTTITVLQYLHKLVIYYQNPPQHTSSGRNCESGFYIATDDW